MNDARTSISASSLTRTSATPPSAGGVSPRNSTSTSLSRTAARRQLKKLKGAIDGLQAMVESSDTTVRLSLSEHEKNRRRNIILGLCEQRDVLVRRLTSSSSNTSSPSDGPNSNIIINNNSSRLPAELVQPRETDATAVRSNAELLQMQREVLEEQEEALGHLERSVGGVKRLAGAVLEESELQNRLLDDFDEEVGLTNDQVFNLRQRVRRYVEQKGCCGCGSSGVGCLFVVTLVLLVVLILVVKVLVM